MARIVGGIGASHSPTIAFAKDTNKQNDPIWSPIFEGFDQLKSWVAEKEVDVLFFIFNDHVTSFFFDHYSPFVLGIDDQYCTADEGGGARDFPPAKAHQELSRHIAHSMAAQEFDISTFQKKPLDHGFFSPFSMMVPGEVGKWQGKVVPLQVGVLQFPAPTAKRCFNFGKALRKAILSFPEDLNVAIVATGGLSHQVHGERCGFNDEQWDQEFLSLLETDPNKLTELTHADYAIKGGMEGAEVIMWLIMRGALSDDIKCVHKTSYCPSMTNIATVVFEEQQSTEAVNHDPFEQLHGLDTLSGTYPFTVETSHRAYRLNGFLRRLIEPEHRQRFVTDQRALMEEYELSDEEINLVSERNWIGLIRYGVIFFCLEKMAAVLGLSNPEVYAAMRGQTMEQFQASRKVSMTYSVSAK